VLSLKAGGTGLNPTAASRVFHFDRWWNPAVERLATDRAFRIGQRRNVTSWRAGEMISRWTAAGPLHAKQGFHRIKGYRHLPLLARALRAQASQLDATVEAA
jgi:hypothetical protein